MIKTIRRPKPIFCHFCGSKLETRPIRNSYNTQTGKQNTERYCPNLTCKKGCIENGGHILQTLDSCGYLVVCTRCKYAP